MARERKGDIYIMKVLTKIRMPGMYDYMDQATKGSAGIDLRSTINTTIYPKQTVKIDTGISIWIQDPAYAGLILARSSTATKQHLAPANKVGLIDSDYQGPLIVALHNHGQTQQEIVFGERIAQLIIIPVFQFELDIVDSFAASTERGEGGFGSTGKH